MRKLTLLAASALALAVVPAPAAADIVPVPATSIQGANVLFQDDVQEGTSIMGMLNDDRNTGVTFSAGGNVITSFSGGQARISGALDTSTNNPLDTMGLTNLMFSLTDGGTFNNLELNVFGGDADEVAFTLVDNMGDIFTGAAFTFALTNGENFFGFQGINGQSIASVSLQAIGGTIGDVRQIRFDAVDASNNVVPEPGTWAMMLIGFGAAGTAMRRRRRSDKALPQIA
jgi:hypothetical protein